MVIFIQKMMANTRFTLKLRITNLRQCSTCSKKCVINGKTFANIFLQKHFPEVNGNINIFIYFFALKCHPQLFAHPHFHAITNSPVKNLFF